MSTGDLSVEMLDELTHCAFRMGQAIASEAERAETLDRKLELVQVFDRCFFSVRMGISLKLRLQRERALHAVSHGRSTADHRTADAAEVERADAVDPPEREGEDALPRERERERDVERASLPALVRALRGVADVAATSPGPEPEDLPRLRGLLAALPEASAPRRASRTPPPAAFGLRARLGGSTSLPPIGPPGHSAGLRGPLRRGAGPPGR